MLLTLLALAAPLPAFAISDEADSTGHGDPGPAAISVSTSLDSCGVLDDGVVCKLDVSFNSIPNADSYSATVTRADGSVIDYGAVGAGGTSLWVPYVGSGNYSVRITAYGEPDTPEEDADGRGEVIATGYSTRRDDRDEPSARTARGRGRGERRDRGHRPRPGGQREPRRRRRADAPTSAPRPTAAQPTCTTPPSRPPAPPTPPEEPPADLDPENPDEDADGIPDEARAGRLRRSSRRVPRPPCRPAGARSGPAAERAEPAGDSYDHGDGHRHRRSALRRRPRVRRLGAAARC